jgi:16S rRNA (cytosine967-C5)-methyltransferase
VSAPVPDPRRVAVDALVRIARDGAYANLLLPRILARSGLSTRDRAFATQLVYGTVRMARACDWFVDRFALGDLDDQVRAALRVGTFQLRFLGTPPHAAVSATVDTVPRRARGLVNAVLRKIAAADDAWPSEAVRLSYPDHVVARLEEDLGVSAAAAALEAMNAPAAVAERDDGYVQDPASQLVVDAVEAQAGERVLDLCAAPGGKATGLASAGGWVVAADVRSARVRLIQTNAERLGLGPERLVAVVADGTRSPFAPGSFDRVLVDAPCSGLGSLRRRPDARWRIDAEAPERLARLQQSLLAEAATLVAPGGRLVYSVCTLTAVETTGVADAFGTAHPSWTVQRPAPATAAPWESWGTGAVVLPQTAGTDGMALFAWQRPDHDGRDPGQEPA